MGLQVGDGVHTNSSSINAISHGGCDDAHVMSGSLRRRDLLVFTRPQESVHSVPSGALKAEIERVSTEIDKIFADGLAEVTSIPGDAAHRTKRVQTLGKLLLFDKQSKNSHRWISASTNGSEKMK